MDTGPLTPEDRAARDHPELWARWLVHRDPAARAALVDAYTRFTRYLAGVCHARRPHHGLEFGDYLQFGLVGLMESIDRFDPVHGVKFESFAGYRIQGAIWNGVEQMSEVQKQSAMRRRVLKERAASLASGARPANAESALERLAGLAIGLAIGFALEDSGIYCATDEPSLPDNAYARTELAQMKSQLAACVQALPKVQRMVIYRHYFQQVPFDEIAATLSLSKGRISQIHHEALRALRSLYQRRKNFSTTL